MGAPIRIDLSDKSLYNDVYLDWLKSRKRCLLAYGGRDSAKSYSAAQKVVISLLSERYCKVVCLRKIFADIKDSQFETIWAVIETWGLEAEFQYTKSPLEIRCKNGNIVLARGLDRPAKLKSVKDPTIVWIEEADEIAFEDFIKSDTSIRSSYRDALLQIILTFNPENESGWIAETFFPPAKLDYERDDGEFDYVPSPRDDTLILHTTYKHNQWCPPERAERYEALKYALGDDNNYYRVYCLGLWGSALRGLCYENIAYQEDFPGFEEWKVHGYALDFGFTNDPTAVVEVALCHGDLYVQELTYRRGLVNVENPKIPGQPNIEAELVRNEIEKSELIIADSAEPKSILEIQNAGFDIRGVKKYAGSVREGVGHLRKYRLIVCGESPNLKKELKTYKFKEDKDGNLTNEPIDAWNHCLDALRYWVMYHLMKGGGATSGTVTGLV